MKTKLTIVLLALSLVSSVQAISFRDYYHAHKGVVNERVAQGTLNLVGLELTDLDGIDAVPKIGQLQYLYLSNNQLATIPKSISKLVNLRVLTLAHNRFTAFPTNIMALAQLVEIGLSNNQLATIPESIDTFAQLHRLDLSNNRLTSISDRIGNLAELRLLHLQNNQLTALPESICNLALLGQLCIYNNQLTVIRASIGTLAYLQRLDLYDNPIPLTMAQVRTQLHLRADVWFRFKTSAQEQAERDLFSAIQNGDYAKLQQKIADIRSGVLTDPDNRPIDIAKIRDKNGNNLLHAAIQDAAKHLRLIQNKSNEGQGNLERQIAGVNASYMKIIGAILSCGDQGVDMLLASDAHGHNVMQAVLSDPQLGQQSPIFKALAHLLNALEGCSIDLSLINMRRG